MKRGDIVEIFWYDSCGVTHRWEFIDEMDKYPHMVVQTVGYVWENEQEYITVAQSYSDTQVIGLMAIPTRAIVSQNILKEAGND